MTESILRRLSSTSFGLPADFYPLQAQVEGLVSHFVEEAASPATLAALMAGGMAYRFGRVGVLAAGEGRLAAAPLRLASYGFGLGAEVGAYEFTNRVLQTVGAAGRPPADSQNPNLWSWSGPGGWAQGLGSSALTFGLLKGAGFLAREQNLVLQHAFQSTAMVAGQNAVAALGIAPRPEGSFAEQVLHAEATNLQLGAGMGLSILSPRACPPWRDASIFRSRILEEDYFRRGEIG
jgi:hypothetical protein